jgi:hypothetical protein
MMSPIQGAINYGREDQQIASLGSPRGSKRNTLRDQAFDEMAYA